MTLSLHTLYPGLAAKKSKKRVGRGNASGKGTYAGRGIKGQRARSGGKSGLKLKALKPLILSTPKLGGFKSLKAKKEVVNLSVLDKYFNDGDIVTPEILKEKKLIKKVRNGIKILANGELKKKLTIENCAVSQSAREKIEAVGGTIKE